MLGHSTVLKLVVCGILCFAIGLVVLNFMSSDRRQTDVVLAKQDLRQSNVVTTKQAKTYTPVRRNEKLAKVISKSEIAIDADYKSADKPKQLTNNNKIDISKISIQKKKIVSKSKTNKTISVRECGQGNYHILLFHGQKSSSKIWEDIGTLQYLCQWGYHAFAIDIPAISANNSLPVEGGDQEAVKWLTDLIRKLHLRDLVLISPSMSGRLTLPYLVQLNDQQTLIQGFVAIAPTGTKNYKSEDFKKIKIPTLIVHGENDKQFASAFECLKQIPKNEILLIKDASHASYVEKPMEFHNNLRQFLYKIYRPIYQNESKFSKKKQHNKIQNKQ